MTMEKRKKGTGEAQRILVRAFEYLSLRYPAASFCFYRCASSPFYLNPLNRVSLLVVLRNPGPLVSPLYHRGTLNSLPSRNPFSLLPYARVRHFCAAP